MERTLKELQYKQALPLEIKVKMTQNRIREWVKEFGTEGVYVSFSGGKDSTVLLHIVREMYPNIPAVFVDTGLEYPEIREFVKTFDNVEWLKPEINFKQVIDKYGYPFISKETSAIIGGGSESVSHFKRRGYRHTQQGNSYQRMCFKAKEAERCVESVGTMLWCFDKGQCDNKQHTRWRKIPFLKHPTKIYVSGRCAI